MNDRKEIEYEIFTVEDAEGKIKTAIRVCGAVVKIKDAKIDGNTINIEYDVVEGKHSKELDEALGEIIIALLKKYVQEKEENDRKEQ